MMHILSAAYCSAAAMKNNAENKEKPPIRRFLFYVLIRCRVVGNQRCFLLYGFRLRALKILQNTNTPRKNSHGVSEGDFSFQENGIKREKLLPRLFPLFSSDPIDVPFKVAAVQ